MNLPDNNPSSAKQRLSDARLKQWHQQGEALLTIENARSFLNATGLVLFAPRPQITAPAPSFVEAVLGEPNAAPTLAQTEQARELLARLVAEGLAVPLNLLGLGSVVGQSSDAPDFIASAQIFSYVFTLRGDKGWKQPPQSTGTAKFSNLAVATHEALTQHGPMAVSDLVRELGKEVTEAAVLRALGELWMHLRVLPLPQLDGLPTLWELASTRLIKQIKAGANAGLPTALSVLISLYLGQAIGASEDEIESFLSPLAARSRVRDVLHALLAAQQLQTVAIEGKTMLHVAGAANAFLGEETQAVSVAQEGPDAVGESAAPEETTAAADDEEHGVIETAEPGSRIAKFTPRRKPTSSDLAKAKPAKSARKLYVETRKPFGEGRKPFGERKPFAPRDGKGRPPSRDGKTARPFPERSGFKRAEGSGGEGRPQAEGRPRFVRPERLDGKPDRERRPFVKREGSDSRPARKAFDRSGDSRPARKPFDRSGDSRPPRKTFDRGGDRPAPRKAFDRSSDSRPPRKPFDRTGERPAGRKPFGRPDRFAPKREFASGEDRPKRDFKPRSFEGRKPFGGPKKSFDRPKPFGRRAEAGEGGEEKGRPSSFGGKRPFAKPGGFGKKPGGFSKPFHSKERDGERGERPTRSGPGFGAKKFGTGNARGPKFGDKPGGRKFGPKPGSGFGAKKFGAKKFGDKKPFGKPKGPRGPRPSRSQGDAEA